MAPSRNQISGQSGFTLPELLVALMIGLVVAAAAMTVVISAVKGQPRLNDRSAQIQQGRTMLERLSRELRQGDEVTDATASGLRVHTYVSGADCGGAAGTTVPCWVTYACGSSSCTRTPEGAAPVTVVRDISGPNVFCYAPWDGQAACAATNASDPAYVALRLVFPKADGTEAVTFDDGIALRNFQG